MSYKKKFPITFSILSLAAFFFLIGVGVGRYHLFLSKTFSKAEEGLDFLLTETGLKEEWIYPVNAYKDIPLPPASEPGDALTLVTRTKEDHQLAVELYDMQRRRVHEWHIDWFKNWPNAKHLGKNTPIRPPGTHVHGAIVTADGYLIFNFERLGLVKMAPDSTIVWKLPVRTHHSAFQASDGHIWVCSLDDTRNETESFPSIRYAWDETALEVDPKDGSVLRKIHLFDVLENNGLRGLLYSKCTMSPETIGSVSGDILHMNDVEIFPDNLDEGFFKRGDIMISLRNISTILVLDPKTLKIKFRSTGQVDYQHDPDFIDGNTITVLDNSPHYKQGMKLSSRIVKISAPEGTASIVFEGTDKTPFFTNIMGKHQWLPNGNLLITESRKGRGFEINPEGKIVWEFRNTLDNGRVGLVDEVQRLTPATSSLFLQ